MNGAFDPSLMDDADDGDDPTRPRDNKEDGPTIVDSKGKDIKELSESDSEDGVEKRLDWLYEAAPTGKDNNDINAAFQIDS